jgi:hypothetical protein
LPDFGKKILSIARFSLPVPVGGKKYKKVLIFSYFHLSTCGQIWLNRFPDDSHLGTSQNWKKKPWLTPCYLLVIGITFMGALGSAEWQGSANARPIAHTSLIKTSSKSIRQCLVSRPSKSSQRTHATKMKRNEFLRKKMESKWTESKNAKEVTENIRHRGWDPPQPSTQSK